MSDASDESSPVPNATIVFDVGGIDANQEWTALDAAAVASLELDGINLIAVGDEAQIAAYLRHTAHDAEQLRIVHAPEVVPEGLPIHAAQERFPDSSIAVGMKYAARLPDAGFVSAGHSGLIVSTAMEHASPLPHVVVPAMAAVYPTLRHRGAEQDPFALLLDVGACTDCSPEAMVQFAVMGAVYSQSISRNERPRIAVLSNSQSARQAPNRVMAAHEELQSLNRDWEYIGLMRADQVTLGEADVVITDGFTGDVLMRTLEGVATSGEQLLARARDRFKWRLGMSILGSGLQRLRQLADWENYGGAPLLGLDTSVIVTQSNAGQRAFVNALRLSRKIRRLDVQNRIREALADTVG